MKKKKKEKDKEKIKRKKYKKVEYLKKKMSICYDLLRRHNDECSGSPRRYDSLRFVTNRNESLRRRKKS